MTTQHTYTVPVVDDGKLKGEQALALFELIAEFSAFGLSFKRLEDGNIRLVVAEMGIKFEDKSIAQLMVQLAFYIDKIVIPQTEKLKEQANEKKT